MPLHYRLIVRSRDDTADLIVVSTDPSTAHPFILTAPTGDGEKFDPLTGKTEVGGQSLQIIDAPHATSSRVITRELADAVKRWNLNGNKALLQYAEAEPISWATLTTGYLTRHELTDALAFDVEVGETRYLEERYELFKTVSTNFDRASNLVGPLVRGGFNILAADPPWRFRANSIQPTLVGMQLLSPSFSSIGFHQRNLRAKKYRTEVGKPAGVSAWYPRMLYRVETVAGVFVGHFTPFAGPRSNDLGVEGDLLSNIGASHIYMDWPAGGAIAQPAVNTEFLVWGFPVDIDEYNPLHAGGHPIDLHTLAYAEAGIAYDAASATATRSAIGADLWYDMRKEHAEKLSEFAREMQGAFGYGTRIGPAGERVFFVTRIRSASAPVLTITKDDLRDEGTPFSLDVESAVSSVAVEQLTFARFDPAIDAGEPALDGLVAVKQRAIGTVPDSIPLGQHEVAFTLDGQIMQRTFSLLPPVGEMVRVPINFTQFAKGIGAEIGDRYGRGAWRATHHLRRGINVNIGEEIILDLDYQPNPETTPASRGGQRVVQVVQRTPTPFGLDVELVDSGNAAQLVTAPTFTLAAAAEDPKRTVIATLTNAAALIAQGSLVRIEWATGGATRTLLTVHDPNTGTDIRLPQVDSGATVDVGMRSEHPTRRPSGYQTATLNLVDLVAPSSSTAVNRTITWAVGEADAWVELLYKLTTDTQYQRLAFLAPGATSFVASSLAGGVNYDVQIRHRDAPPLNGVSAAQTILLTPSGSAAPAPPTAPSIWAGHPNPRGVIEIDGTYGYDVTAVVVPGAVEFEVALETAVGSGVAGAYAIAERVTAIAGGRTVFQGYAPSDGRRRYVRAYSVTPDGVRSATASTALSILPWTSVTPTRTSRDLIRFSDAAGADDGYAMRASHVNGRESDLSLYFPTTAPPAVGTVAVPGSLSKPVTISCTEFLPEARTTEWFLNSGRWIRPLVFSSDVYLYAPLIIPVGVTITSVGARLYRAANDVNIFAEYWFARIADDGTDTLLVSVQAHASSGWVTLSNVLSELVTDKRYIFGARVRVNSGGLRALEDARIAWFQYSYAMPSYDKTL